jgi:Ni,Fe-hydrogenase III large subunit
MTAVGASKTYTIPVGPLHVALEEPMYFHIDVEGETVREVDIRAGHVHRGVEYLTTKRSIYQNVVLTERICALCSNSHPETFVMACEQIAGLEIPERAAYLRVIAAEIKRIASHLFNIGILAHLTGYDTLFMYAMQVREIMQDVKETLFGNRMDIAAMCIGGVRYDLDAETKAYLSAALDKLAPEVDGLADTYRRNHTILRRSRGIGLLTKEQAIACATVGPVARACGLEYDVRVAAPYAAYDRLKVNVPTLVDGDVWSRAMIRVAEIGASIQLLRDCLSDLPDGPTRLPDRPEIPAGRAMGKCEAPRGELVYFLKTTGADEPERVKWRVPSFPNWDALRFMLRGAKIADIAVIVNSIDPCVSCTER